MERASEQDKSWNRNNAGGNDAVGAGRLHSQNTRSLAFSSLFVISAAVGGAALPFAFGEMFPRSYTSTAMIGVEDSAKLDVLATAVKAASSIERVSALLHLDRERLLAETAPGPLSVAVDLLTGGEGTAARPAEVVKRTLARSVSIMPDRHAGRLSLAVTTGDAGLSARIVNAFAEEGVSNLSGQVLDEAYGLTAARVAAEQAEQQLSDFTRSQEGAALDAAAILASDIAERNADIQNRQAMLSALTEESKRVSSLTVSDSGPSASGLALDAPAFDSARDNYIAAKLDYDQQTAALGPRHPRLQAARNALDDARNRLQDALRKLDAGYKEKVKAASRALDQAKAERMKLDVANDERGSELARLEALKRQADRLRADYLDKLDISAVAPRPQAPARIITVADVNNVIVHGVSPLLVSVAGACIGFLAGFAWLHVSGRRRTDDADLRSDEEPALKSVPAQGYGQDDVVVDDAFDDEWGVPAAQNDDVPLADRLRAVLRRSTEMDERDALRALRSPREVEMDEIRRRMEALKYRLKAYTAHRSSYRR